MKAIITLRKDKKNKYGQCPIVIQLNEGKIVLRIPLGESIDPIYFNATTQLVSDKHPNNRSINSVLNEAKKKIKLTNTVFHYLTGDPESGFLLKPVEYCQVYRQLYNAENTELELNKLKEQYSLIAHTGTVSKRPAFVKFEKRIPIDKYAEVNNLIDKYLSGLRDEFIQRIIDLPEFDESDDDQKHFMDAWDSYYKYCKIEKKQSTYSRIPNNRKILVDFCKKYNRPLTFSAMNEDFGREFKYYLANEHINIYSKEKGVSNGTVHNIQKSICAFLNWAFKKGVNPSLEFKKWDTRKPKSDQHYLRENELKLLLEAEVFLTPAEEKVKDLFLFAAYTGMRYSDVLKFSKALINDGIIKFTSEKTGKKCVVKLLPIAEQILVKYNYELPISVSDCNSKIKIILRKVGITQEVARTLQKGKQNITTVKPLADFITFHSARRSFINLMISKGVQVAHLSTMVGNDIPSLMVYYKNDTTQIDKIMSRLEL